MSAAAGHGVVAFVVSVVWGVAFVVAVDNDALYSVVGSVAAVAVAVVLWRHPALRVELRGQGNVGRPFGAMRAAGPADAIVDVAVGLAVGVALVVGTHVGFRVMTPLFPSLGDDVARLYRVAAVSPARLVAVVVIAAAEEVVWRGLLLDALRRRLPEGAGPLWPTVAVVGSALVYAAAQVGPRSAWLLVAAVAMGILWGAMRLWRSLWMPLASHLVWTLAILGGAPLPPT